MNEQVPTSTLGVIVCCRDEERVIERRLANLARSQWPPSVRPHRVVVVDDGSRDATARLASAEGARKWPAGIVLDVIRNAHRPGKSGAIASGLEHLGTSVDLAVLTDADVVNAEDALVLLAAAFARSPRLGMACGSQRFVDGLPADGATASLGAGHRGGTYDRITSWVRAVESRSGRAFSMHGQLLAWRVELGLQPSRAMAADDLDLMVQARRRNARVERVAGARFFEVKPAGSLQRIQALRRARAYVQFARALDSATAPDRPTLWQWRAYRYVPLLFPWFAIPAGIAIACLWTIGLMLLLDALQPTDRDWIRWLWLLPALAGIRLWQLCGVIVEAKRLERAGTLDDRWSTAR